MVCSRLGISRSLTSVEHPQSDGLVERMNRTLKTSLSIVVGSDLKTWAQHLPFVVFAYNTAKQESNYNTRQWIDFLNQEIPIVHAKAIENIKKAQQYQKTQYNKKSKEIAKYKTGDLVLRRNHNKMSAFLKERWLGPGQIIQAINKDGSAYRIMKPGDIKSLSKVNVVDLRPFHKREDDVVTA
ncbi:hypothetical protein G6F37_012607 [Rhizopus arrhizus]|nr:hypothetical protein G6F38_012674 [Rhizopus arrhizus]KAG1142596.1 hypothetical protein G6F37_012607 [Rhizopus arrhizus]